MRAQSPTTGAAAMQQVTDWLEKLGLGQYAERFAENGISIAALPHLSDQDLKDVGVLLGHRRIMLAALGELVPGATTAERSAAVAPLPQDTAERRQVTLMFSDLVGSTALSARMDLEDLREVISAYQKCVDETVKRFGGFVAKYMGDGLDSFEDHFGPELVIYSSSNDVRDTRQNGFIKRRRLRSSQPWPGGSVEACSKKH
jgi:class 3 adenylate cyclase